MAVEAKKFNIRSDPDWHARGIIGLSGVGMYLWRELCLAQSQTSVLARRTNFTQHHTLIWVTFFHGHAQILPLCDVTSWHHVAFHHYVWLYLCRDAPSDGGLMPRHCAHASSLMHIYVRVESGICCAAHALNLSKLFLLTWPWLRIKPVERTDNSFLQTTVNNIRCIDFLRMSVVPFTCSENIQENRNGFVWWFPVKDKYIESWHITLNIRGELCNYAVWNNVTRCIYDVRNKKPCNVCSSSFFVL